MRQFILFCVGGVIGLFVDMGVLRLLISVFGANAYLGRLVSFLAAATATWLFNRHQTFRGTRHYGLLGEWARYLFAMSGGFVVNFGTYTLIYYYAELAQRFPEIGVATGSVAGLAVNYAASRLWIYRRIAPGRDQNRERHP
ncbi:MAG: GtrA family protein [Tahibacter sp.]